MYCDRCGHQVENSASFCPSCGKPTRTVPLAPPHGRIAGHIRLLGIFWLGLSAFRLIPGLALLTIFGRDFPPGMPDFVHGLLSGLGWLFLGSAAAGLLAGWGLLQREPWARTLTIILGVLALPDMPFGTALGIYTLWVLLPAKSEEEYREVSRAA